MTMTATATRPRLYIAIVNTAMRLLTFSIIFLFSLSIITTAKIALFKLLDVCTDQGCPTLLDQDNTHFLKKLFWFKNVRIEKFKHSRSKLKNQNFNTKLYSQINTVTMSHSVVEGMLGILVHVKIFDSCSISIYKGAISGAGSMLYPFS